jgi:predicted dehydrogenase
LTALVDPVESFARATAERFGISPVIATRLSEVIGQIDAAIVATPNHTHCPLALECIAAGIPVLIEKPLAISSAEGRQIVDASEAAGVPVAVGYQTRFMPQAEMVRDIVRRNRFGTVTRFAYQFGSLRGWAPVSGYNLDRRSAGGGVLTGNGSHFLDRLIDWFGYPDEASLVDDSAGGPEANALASFRYVSNGRNVTGTARFSRTVALQPGMVLETDQGVVIALDSRINSVVFRPNDQPGYEMELRSNSESRSDGRLHADKQLDEFLDSIAQGRPPMISARVGLESVRLLEHLYAHRQAMPDDWYRTNPEGSSALGSGE